MEQTCFLSHWSKYRGSCGHSRGITELVRLAECNDSVVSHLSSCHLSRERSHGKRITVFTRISATTLIKFFALQMRRLFEGGAYLKGNLFFQFNGISSICTNKIQLVIEASFHRRHSPLSTLFSGVFTQLRSHFPFYHNPFLKKNTFPVRF